MKYILVIPLCFLLVRTGLGQKGNVRLNVHSGGYYFGWQWFNQNYDSANDDASSTALFSGLEMEIPIFNYKEKFTFSSFIGYRNILSNGFVEMVQEGRFIFVNPKKNDTHFINFGLQALYRLNKKYSFGTNVDVLYFIEKEFDIYNQKRFAANLDLLLRKKINSRFSIGLKSPIRLLPYAEWRGSNSISVGRNGKFDPNAKLTPYHVRTGAIGISLMLTYVLF